MKKSELRKMLKEVLKIREEVNDMSFILSDDNEDELLLSFFDVETELTNLYVHLLNKLDYLDND